MKALITRKVGMISTIAEDGAVRAVTLLQADPNTITQLKNTERDGYTAVQLGYGTDKHLNKAQIGHFKASQAASKVVREFRMEELSDDLKVGGQVSAENFEVGDHVHVTATSKGKGWAGTIKRHNFQRGRKTHGGRSYRRPGSIGSMFPQKIFKGKKMAGQMGHDQVTVRNLEVALIDNDNHVIGVSGAVPGPRKAIVIVRGA
jgi:large subunit ribosomal protein L3